METYFPFNQILNNIILWAKRWEEIILNEGKSLNQEQLNLAARLNIQHPEKIRVLVKKVIPVPPEPAVVAAAKTQGLDLNSTAGITFGYGIVILESRADDLKLLTHELVHVKQYESLGFEDFLKKYISECLILGYNNCSLEIEAVELTDKIFKT